MLFVNGKQSGSLLEILDSNLDWRFLTSIVLHANDGVARDWRYSEGLKVQRIIVWSPVQIRGLPVLQTVQTRYGAHTNCPDPLWSPHNLSFKLSRPVMEPTQTVQTRYGAHTTSHSNCPDPLWSPHNLSFKLSRPVMEPTQSLIQWVPSSGVKRWGQTCNTTPTQSSNKDKCGARHRRFDQTFCLLPQWLGEDSSVTEFVGAFENGGKRVTCQKIRIFVSQVRSLPNVKNKQDGQCTYNAAL